MKGCNEYFQQIYVFIPSVVFVVFLRYSHFWDWPSKDKWGQRHNFLLTEYSHIKNSEAIQSHECRLTVPAKAIKSRYQESEEMYKVKSWHGHRSAELLQDFGHLW